MMLVSTSSRPTACAALAGVLLLAGAAARAQEPASPVSDTAEPAPAAGSAASPAASPVPDAAPTTPSSSAPPAAPARAPESHGPLSLTWVSTDPSCDGSDVGPRALELVSPALVPRPTEARATVEREGERWRVQLETRSQSHLGQRTLRGESCKEIQQAIALLLAMIMEAEAKGESPTGPMTPPVALSMLNPDEDPVVDAPALPTPPARDWAVVLRTEGAAGVGLQPSLGLGVGASAGIAFGSFEVHLGGAYWPKSRTAVFEREGAIEMSRLAAGASLCYRWLSSGRMDILSCLGPEWLWMRWNSTGLLRPRNGTISHLLTLNGTIDLRFTAVGPLFVALTPGFTWEQRRPFQAKRCEDCAPTDVFHTWDIGLRFGAGVGARF